MRACEARPRGLPPGSLTRVKYSRRTRFAYWGHLSLQRLTGSAIMSTPRFDQFLTEDHRACDALLGTLRTAARAGDWAAAGEAFRSLRHDVLAHFAAEEEILFPAFEQRTGMSCGPTRVMRMEHDEARELLLDLAEAVTEADADAVRGHAEALLILLQQHNMKEENILYPTAVDVSREAVPQLSEQIQARRLAA